jgi:hypothetical protein
VLRAGFERGFRPRRFRLGTLRSVTRHSINPHWVDELVIRTRELVTGVDELVIKTRELVTGADELVIRTRELVPQLAQVLRVGFERGSLVPRSHVTKSTSPFNINQPLSV